MAAVAGDCAPRLGTWPTLKKLRKSCQEEKGSGTAASTDTQWAVAFFRDGIEEHIYYT